ncbi:VOC family protein [Pseudomonadota bacterium]|jgi:catechol 2,3-dioxygenase-like lactoylglutathione lyase family enzyme|nr:VOC family protein [Pseudomonadota bacterium]|tara:strand:+ start:257 stop:673 length:417 start_codon:yes stop_codon:yes gene_type:complete
MKLEFHHINFVSKNIDNMNEFYINILEMDSIPIEKFPRTEETVDSGYSGKINFVTEGKIEMHLAERDINVAFKNNHTINPVDKGHIAFRTDDINSFINKLKKENIPFSDYGTTFAKEWHQVFFHDPEGNVVEVHQKLN